MKKQFDFKLYDCFYDDSYKECDFRESSHINFNGALKFTKIFIENI